MSSFSSIETLKCDVIDIQKYHEFVNIDPANLKTISKTDINNKQKLLIMLVLNKS